MRQILFIILAISIPLFALFSESEAQVIRGDVHFQSQAQVDSFSGTSITGAVKISGSLDLTPLLILTSIGGSLTINTSSFINFDGLNNITSVGGSIKISDNPHLINLDGLSGLTYVGGDLKIFLNRPLANIDGLRNIAYVGGNLYIRHNRSLDNFCGLFTLLNKNGLVGDYIVSDNRKYREDPTKYQIIVKGPCTITRVLENLEPPKDYKLEQNFPNPFNPITTISYQLPKDSFVTLIVFDILGKEVITLVDDYKKSGKYNIVFDGENLISGTYFYKITIGNFTDFKKLILIK